MNVVVSREMLVQRNSEYGGLAVSEVAVAYVSKSGLVTHLCQEQTFGQLRNRVWLEDVSPGP